MATRGRCAVCNGFARYTLCDACAWVKRLRGIILSSNEVSVGHLRRRKNPKLCSACAAVGRRYISVKDNKAREVLYNICMRHFNQLKRADDLRETILLTNLLEN